MHLKVVKALRLPHCGDVMQKILTLCCLLLLSACTGVNVERVPYKDPIIPPQDADPAPLALSKTKLGIPTGDPIASNSPRGLLGLINCKLPYGNVDLGRRARKVDRDQYKEIFKETLESLGYDITGGQSHFFDEDDDFDRTIFSVGALIKEIHIDSCKHDNWWSVDQGVTGEASMTVEWTLFDRLHRKVVLKTTTKGYSELNFKNYDGLQLLAEDAFAAAAHNLGADEEFYNVVFRGIAPERPLGLNFDPLAEEDGIFNPNEDVDISNKALFKTPAQSRLKQLAQSTVMIQTGNDHGSGFFISEDGHILTTASTIGYAKRVRVVTARKKEKLIAETLRVDRKRDVALLKLVNKPNDYTITTLPIRTGDLNIGEDIYAIGAPYKYYLNDTVTKGIVSTYRYRKTERQWYIQGDAYTHDGSYGGPLLDASGNLIGISASMYKEDAELNLFIPIEDALDELDITLNGQNVAFKPPK